MKRWAFQILAALALATALAAPPSKESATTVHTFEEPVWKPVQLRGVAGGNLPELDSRLEFIAMPNYVRHGTPVVHLGLRNNQATERTFIVEFLPHNDNQRPSAATITRSVTLPRLGTANLTFPVFRVHAERGGTFDKVWIRETTVGTSRHVGEINCHRTINTRKNEPHILMDHRLSPESFSKHLAEGKTNNAEYCSTILRFKRAAADWSDDYRVYSTFDAVVVTPSLYAAFPSAVRQALDDFTAFGGAVLVTPDDTESGGLDDPMVQDRFQFSIANSNDYLSEYSYDAEFALESVPLNLKNHMPIFWLISLLGIFTVVFIPVVVGICIRRNRRFHSLAIIPVAAATLALVVGISSLVFYGSTPTERLQSVTILDQRRHHAATWGQFAVFAPSPKSGEIAFPLDSTFLQRNFDSVSPHLERRLGVEIDDGYRLVGDWVQPLIPTIFDFQRVAQRSEKLDVKPVSANEIQVVNLLGVPITGGRLCLNGNLYFLNGIQPGETQILKTTTSAIGKPDPDRNLYHQLFADQNLIRHWPKLVKHLTAAPRLAPLPEATYIAFVEGSPFFPSPFGQRQTHGTREAIVVGQFAEGTK